MFFLDIVQHGRAEDTVLTLLPNPSWRSTAEKHAAFAMVCRFIFAKNECAVILK